MKEFAIIHNGEGKDDWSVCGSEEELEDLIKYARLGEAYYKQYEGHNLIRFATNDISDLRAVRSGMWKK